MIIQQYLENPNKFFQIEYALEHSYRSNKPSQTLLKDRKDIELSYEDILHYNKIIVTLTETDRLMKEIDNTFEI